VWTSFSGGSKTETIRSRKARNLKAAVMECLLFQIVIVKMRSQDTKEKAKTDVWMEKKLRELRRFRMFSFKAFLAGFL